MSFQHSVNYMLSGWRGKLKVGSRQIIDTIQAIHYGMADLQRHQVFALWRYNQQEFLVTQYRTEILNREQNICASHLVSGMNE